MAINKNDHLMVIKNEVISNTLCIASTHKRRNAPFILIILSIFFFLNCDNPNETEKRNAVIEYARTYSSTLSQRNWDDKYWNIIGEFDDVTSCNDVADLNKSADERYNLKEDYWYWEDVSYRKEYQNERKSLR